MNESPSKLPIPRWLPIATAVCVLIPDLILLNQLLPEFRAHHQLHPDIQAMGHSEAELRVGSFVGELVRPTLSVLVAWGVWRRQRLNLAAIYLALRIVVPLILAMRAPQVFDWGFAPMLLHVAALVGVMVLRSRENQKQADNA